jgi:hypothetical protein
MDKDNKGLAKILGIVMFEEEKGNGTTIFIRREREIYEKLILEKEFPKIGVVENSYITQTEYNKETGKRPSEVKKQIYVNQEEIIKYSD